jgi:protocatechuate 3,4-dioxygenase beta subunit
MASNSTHRVLLAVLLVLGGLTGVIVSLLLWQDASRVGSRPAPGAEVREADDASRAKPGRARADRALSDPGRRRRGLDAGSAAGASARESTPQLASESAPRRAPSAAATRLPEGSGRIVFSVQDGSGRALRDASVTLRALDLPGSAEVAVTGGDGEARFVGLAPGHYAYRAQARDRPELASAESVQLGEGEWKELTVRLVGANLGIGGRVLSQNGEPVPGIDISVARHRFASTVSEAAPGDRFSLRTRSRADGSFEIAGLAEGEYDVATIATNRYSSAKAIVQAGGAPVDLILFEGLRVHGTVKNSSGEPLAHVRVGLRARRDLFAHTDDGGSYQLHLDPDAGNANSMLRFYLQGYEEELVSLPAPDAEAPLEVRLDATLRVVEDAARVSGLVRTERGEPVAGATVALSARIEARYQTVSGEDGSFSIPGVKVGAGYYLRVLAPPPFTDYSQRDIRVTEDGVSLEVVLESLETGRLTGRMIDAERNPIPGFRLWLATAAAVRSAVPITSDERGYFELAEAPAGSLSLDTRSSPRLRVTGISLPARGEVDVLLVLDWGDHEMEGKALDDRGDPVGGADVSLSWSHDRGGPVSSSRRGTRTDDRGVFRFTQLGPGKHVLEVRAEGYAPLAERHEIGRYAPEVEVRLEPSSH